MLTQDDHASLREQERLLHWLYPMEFGFRWLRESCGCEIYVFDVQLPR